MRRFTLPAIFATLAATQATFADVTVAFIEGAPKDRFIIATSADCPLGETEITIDLATAPAGLIFDTTGSGAGVEVFQPFELVSGADQLKTLPRVNDGDQSVTLALTSLSAASKIAFTVDVDDTGGGREITVSGAEIAGATIRIKNGTHTASAEMNTKALAMIETRDCAS